MALDIHQFGQKTLGAARHPRTRRIALWIVSIVFAIGVLLGLVAPPLIRDKAASALSEKLHRPVTIEQIAINPYALTLAVRGFLMKERQGDAAALSFEELFVNLELRSLFRLGPVVKELRLIKPYVSVVRNEDLSYNFQDLIDEFTKGPKEPGPTPRFSLNNIEIIEGRLDFDDRPEKTKHSVAQLRIGVPFISSLPTHVDIKVKPEFSALINGAPLHLAGDSVPFKASRDSTIGFDIENLELAQYLTYSPVPLNFTMPSGHLGGKLNVSFKSAKDNPAVLKITGNLALRELALQSGGGEFLKLPAFDVLIDAVEVFAHRATLKAVKAQGLELHVQRGRDGKINLQNLVSPREQGAAPEARKETQQDDKPFLYAVEEITLESATIHFVDEQPGRPYKTRLDNVAITVSGLTNEAGKKAQVEAAFESDAKEKFSHKGTLQLTPLAAEGALDLQGLKVAALRPYYDDALAGEIKDGLLDFSAQYSFEPGESEPQIRLSAMAAGLRAFRLELAGQPEPLWRIGALELKDGTVDVAKKSVIIGAIEARDGSGYIQRDRDGTLNLARLVKPAPAAPPPAAAAKPAGAEWRVDAKQVIFDRFRVNVDDRSNAAPAKIRVSDLNLRAENISTAKNQRTRATLRARVNDKGTLRLSGSATANPVNGKFLVDAQDIALVPFQPYLERINLLLTGGGVGTKGELTFDASGSGPAKVSYQGAVQVADFGAVEKTGQQDLLRWKNLNLDALRFDAEPFQLRIGEITLADFYSRLILGADGKLNLQKLTVQEEPQPTAAQPEKQAAETKQPAARPGETTPPAQTEAAEAPKAIAIGKINLREGNIHFSDFFIKPNYSANLTSVQGSISELKPEAPGDLDLQARLDNAAPVEIKGKINPLSRDLFLDIVADAREIELSPMTPYSAKYVGYGIERGKLSFNVKYKVENRKLTANNKIILNQLTFGEKIESPTATKLPVLLAVALMKDRNGVIDVELPISGSLDDPQFSVGGIVLRIVINLITRAVTAPFSLLASAFGGGASGEELSYIEFEPGKANLSKTAQAKIATLAKALENRPALNLEIIGRVDPLTDLDGLKRAGIERKIKAQKLKDLVRKGEAPRSVDDVQIAPGEYPQYLKAAYGEETFPKPRNVIGLAKDIPVPEMEALMLQHAKAGDDEMRQLGQQRAQGVRDALLATKQATGERLFVVAGKPFTAEERAKLKGRPNRVEFAMK